SACVGSMLAISVVFPSNTTVASEGNAIDAGSNSSTIILTVSRASGVCTLVATTNVSPIANARIIPFCTLAIFSLSECHVIDFIHASFGNIDAVTVDVAFLYNFTVSTVATISTLPSKQSESTKISQFAVVVPLPSVEAVIVTGPIACAVTTPLFTVATAVFELDHAIVLFCVHSS